MPSSTTKTAKDLHLASNLGELNKLASVDLPSDARNVNALSYCKVADKMYLKAESHDIERDEESAYVLYMRYFNVIRLIKKTKQYGSEKKFFDDMIGTSKVRRSIGRAEALVESLQERYEDLRQQKQDEEKSKEEVKSKKKKFNCKKPNQSSGSDSDSGVGSLGSDLDVLHSGSGLNSSADVYQKLKISHNAILTPEGTKNTSGNLISGLELPSFSNKPETADVVPSLTAQNLYALLEKEDTSKILILDCRPCAMFAANHINRPCCINIPAELLDQGVSVGSIERRLPERTRRIWKQRGEKEFVIIMDESTQVADISPQCRIQRLKDVIFTFDSYSSLTREPLFLDGGFHSWLWHYPSLALKSELPQVSSNSKIVAPVDLSALDYPQLPEEDKAPVADAQVPHTPKNDSSELKPANPTLPLAGQVDQENAQEPGRNEPAGLQSTAETSEANHEQQALRVSPPSLLQTKGQGPLRIIRDSQPPVIPSTQSSLSSPSLPSSQTGVATVVTSSTPMSHFPTSQSSKSSSLNTPFNASGQQHPVLAPSQTGFPVPNLAGASSPLASVPRQLPSNVLPSQANISLAHPSNVPSSQRLSHPPSQRFVPSPEQQSALSSQSYIPSSQPMSGLPVQHVAPTSGSSWRQTAPPISKPSLTPKPSSSSGQTLPNTGTLGTLPSVTLTGTQAVNGNSMPGPCPLSGMKLPNLRSPSSLPSATLTGGQSVNSTSGAAFASQMSSVTPVSSISTPSSSIHGETAEMSEGSVHSKGSIASELPSPNTLTHQNTQQEHQVIPTVAQLPVNTQMEPTGGGQVLQNSPQALSQGNTTANVSHLAHTPPANPDYLPGNSPVAAGNIAIQPGSETWLPGVQPSPVVGGTLVTTPGLPLGWEKVVDPANGRVYYKDHNSQTTHWELPKAPDPKPNTVQSSGQTQQHSINQREPPIKKTSLRRSLSSPNLAKLSNPGSVSTVPVVDRLSKPDIKQVSPSRPVINRSAKPLTAHQLDNLNPSHGGIGQGLTGLRNLGNTCYMNSVLQCLSSVAPLAAYFISGAYREDVNRSNRDGTRGELAEQFSILICVLHSGRFKCVSPGDLKQTVGKFKTEFSGYNQQDSQELLAFLMDGLQEDLNKVKQKPQLRAPDDDLDPETAAKIAWENHKKRSESLMVELFDGLFMSTVRCLVCQKESYTFETFSNLTLPLPSQKSRCSLQECLKLFTRTEKMSGDDKWFCPKCQQRREASKQIQIWRLPAILIVHLKRFQYDGMWRQKLQTGVSFPMTQLDMSSFVVGPKSRPPYNLHAVSNHYGTMHGGHYTAFCKSVYDNRWYKFDDQFVTEMFKNDVVTSAGYLLFYTSFDFQPPKYLIKGY